jgi:hypothetical protein
MIVWKKWKKKLKISGQINNFMQNLINKFLFFVNNLSSKEIIILAVITAVLLLFIVYRKLGPGAAVALIVLYFIGYVIYRNNLVDFYKHNTSETDSRLKAVEEELQK